MNELLSWYTFGFCLTREAREGIAIPKRFGIAYYDFNRDYHWFALAPFNLLWAWIRMLWLWIKWTEPSRLRMYQYNRIYQKAYWHGYEEGKAGKIPSFN